MAFLEELSRIGNIVSNTASDIQANIDPEYARVLLEREKLRTVKEDKPSDVRSFEYWNQLNPEQQKNFLALKRAQQIMDLGGIKAVYDPMTGGVGSQFQVTPPPSLQPDVVAAAESAKERAKLEEKRELEPQIEQATSRAKYIESGFQTLPKIQRSLESQELREEYLEPVIDDAIKLADVVGTTGWTGSLAKSIPDTPAFDLKSQVQTLLANAGFDRLQEMRDNSPTGGALGQVSERELELLQAASRNLMQSQSKEQFLRNLQAFKEQRTKSLQNVRKAYKEDYKRFGGVRDENLPAPEKPMVKTEDGWSARRID